MDTLINKQFESYTYLCRYTNKPYYYDTINNREIYGIGSQLKKDTQFISHTVKETDNLDYLALKYYGNPTYWWAIAYFNDISDSFIKLSDKFSVLKIPAINSIEFE